MNQNQADDRREEHANDRLRLLEHLRQLNKNGDLPASTSELQDTRIFGLRPVNRIGDLRKLGYDIQRIRCSRGVYRRKLHEPPRPLEKQEWRNERRKPQSALIEQPSEDSYEKLHGPRPSSHLWKKAFSSKRLAADDVFVLTPPEPRP